jgi:hypothetical protein
LNYRAFNIRTKVAVVRLRCRRRAARGRKGVLNGPSGRDAWFEEMADEAYVVRVPDR